MPQELNAAVYGRLLDEVKADWSLAGMLPPVFPIGMEAPKPTGKPSAPPPLAGTLSARSGTSTRLTVAKAPPGQFGRVVARYGKLTGEVRVRVAPVLPYVAAAAFPVLVAARRFRVPPFRIPPQPRPLPEGWRRSGERTVPRCAPYR